MFLDDWLARLFAGARRVRYAWRPAATRTGVRKSVAAARPPPRIDGAGEVLGIGRACRQPAWRGAMESDCGYRKKADLGFQTGMTTGLRKKPKASNAIGS